MLQPFKIDAFPGYNLKAEPAEVGLGGALALSDVDLDRPGKVRTRDGYTTHTTVNVASNYYRPPLLAYDSQTMLALADSGVSVDVIASNGAVSATQTGITRLTGMARFGDPGTRRVYFSGNGCDFRYNGGTSFTAVGTVGTFNCIAVQAPDNRLVRAGDAGLGGGNSDTVQFSGAGTPEAGFETVDVSPGDGENIVALVRWQNFLFAFKQTKFFVFTGNSLNADASTKFNYREVVGAGAVARFSAVAGRDGVYFMGADGFYRTNGFGFERLSTNVDPWFVGDSPDYVPGPTTVGQLVVWGDRVLIPIQTAAHSATQGDTLVFNTVTGQWMRWTLPVWGGCVTHTALADTTVVWTTDKLILALRGGTRLYRFTGTTDNGGAITWSYQSGWYDPSGKDLESSILYSTLKGTGTVSLELLNDYATTGISSAQSVVLGTAPTSDEGYANGQGAGVLYSYKLSGSGPASLDSLTNWLSHVRTSGLRSG